MKFRKHMILIFAAVFTLLFSTQALAAGVPDWTRDAVTGKWYLVQSGVRLTGWQKDGGEWYYLDPVKNGEMKTGWYKEGSDWYYFKQSGAMAKGWYKVSGNWFYFKSSGAMAVGWQKADGLWYYMNQDGIMIRGLRQIDGETYYFDGTGAMVQSNWAKVDGVWYYFNATGARATGWRKVDGLWYYLNPANAQMLTGWQEIDGKTYYFYTDGHMATGDCVIEGRAVSFAADGSLKRNLVHALSAAEVASIQAAYDCSARGYGGLSFYQQAAGVQAQLDAVGNGRALLNTNEKVVALTFQEGWENGYTGQLLDILNSRGVKGCFYITHSYAAHNQALVWRMINEGHDVGSHTYACPDDGIASHSLMDIMNDAMLMQDYMRNTFGYEMTVYNFNSGTWNPGAVQMLTRMGYTTALCSASYSDFNASANIDAGTVLAQMEARLQPGAIYAFHVTNKATVQFIGPLIDYIHSQGYQVVILK